MKPKNPEIINCLLVCVCLGMFSSCSKEKEATRMSRPFSKSEPRSRLDVRKITESAESDRSGKKAPATKFGKTENNVISVEIPACEFLNTSQKESDRGKVRIEAPILARFDGNAPLTAIAYFASDKMCYFLFKSQKGSPPANIRGVYLYSDDDTATGRDKLGNEYYLSPRKNRLIDYTVDKNGSKSPMPLNYKADGVHVMGVPKERLAKHPLTEKTSFMSISTESGKISKIYFDPARNKKRTLKKKKVSKIEFKDADKNSFRNGIPRFNDKLAKRNYFADSDFNSQIKRKNSNRVFNKWVVKNGDAKIILEKIPIEGNSVELTSDSYPDDVRLEQDVTILESGNYETTLFLRNPGGDCRFYVKYEVTYKNGAYRGFRSEYMVVPSNGKWTRFAFAKYMNATNIARVDVLLRCITKNKVIIRRPEFRMVKPDKIFCDSSDRSLKLLHENDSSFLWTAPPPNRPGRFQDISRITRSIKKDGGIRIISAGNDFEPFQIFVSAKKQIRSISFKNGALTLEGDPSSLLRYKLDLVEDILHEGIYVPDVLGTKKKFRMSKDENRIIWGTLEVPKGAHPGKYVGTVSILLDSEEITIPLICDVYPFSLPSTHSFRFMTGVPRGNKYSNRTWRIWCKQLGRHRMSVRRIRRKPTLSFEGDTPVLDFKDFNRELGYLVNKCHMNFFEAPYTYLVSGHNHIFYQTFGPFSERNISPTFKARYAATLSRLVDNLDKQNALDYFLAIIWDEPYAEHIPELKKIAGIVNKSGFRASMFGLVFAGYLPLKGYIKDYICAASLATRPFVNKLHARGDKLFGYNPARPFKITRNPARARRLIWWAAYTGVDGLLQWCCSPSRGYGVRHEDLGHMWVYEHPERVYPNKENRGFLPSVRIEMLREGLEDFEYLKILDKEAAMLYNRVTGKKLDREWTSDLIARETNRGVYMPKEVSGKRFCEIRNRMIKQISWMRRSDNCIFTTKPGKNENEVVVSGIATPGASLTINDEKITIVKSKFKKVIDVNKGIVIKVKENGKFNTVSFTPAESLLNM